MLLYIRQGHWWWALQKFPSLDVLAVADYRHNITDRDSTVDLPH